MSLMKNRRRQNRESLPRAHRGSLQSLSDDILKSGVDDLEALILKAQPRPEVRGFTYLISRWGWERPFFADCVLSLYLMLINYLVITW